MALGANFIQLADLKAYMKITPDDMDDLLQDSIDSTTPEIIRYCHRDFNDAEIASTRTYTAFTDPDEGPMIITDDFSTSVGLVVVSNGTTFSASDLKLYPRNGVMQGLTGWPYWQIRGPFTDGADVDVTVRWGWAAVPNPVKQAAKILAADTFQLKDQRLGIAGSDAFGSVITVKDCRPARTKLAPYRRDSVLVDG